LVSLILKFVFKPEEENATMVEIMGKYGEKIEQIKEEVVSKLEEKTDNKFEFLETPSKSFEYVF